MIKIKRVNNKATTPVKYNVAWGSVLQSCNDLTGGLVMMSVMISVPMRDIRPTFFLDDCNSKS